MIKPVNIIIAESSSIILEGFSAILSKAGIHVQLNRTASLKDVEKFLVSHKKSIVLINPSFVQNNIKLISSLKINYPEVSWICIIYAFFDAQFVSLFDGVITVNDSPETIITLVNKMINPDPAWKHSGQKKL